MDKKIYNDLTDRDEPLEKDFQQSISALLKEYQREFPLTDAQIKAMSAILGRAIGRTLHKEMEEFTFSFCQAMEKAITLHMKIEHHIQGGRRPSV